MKLAVATLSCALALAPAPQRPPQTRRALLAKSGIAGLSLAGPLVALPEAANAGRLQDMAAAREAKKSGGKKAAAAPKAPKGDSKKPAPTPAAMSWLTWGVGAGCQLRWRLHLGVGSEGMLPGPCTAHAPSVTGEPSSPRLPRP